MCGSNRSSDPTKRITQEEARDEYSEVRYDCSGTCILYAKICFVNAIN